MKQRIISGLILLPLPVLALYFGSPYFEVFMAICVAVMGWEWEKMVEGRFTPVGLVMAVSGVMGIFLLDLLPCLAWFVPLFVFAGLWIYAKKNAFSHPKLYAVGMIYGTMPLMAMTLLRAEFGFVAALWTMGVVWGMDTGAYAFGRLIGGPKMAPKISPKKTWAGLFGGMFTAGLWGLGCAYFTQMSDYALIQMSDYALIAGVSAVLGAVSQMGDLLESAIKRYLNVKDSSDLIPGHGGVFDRLDALLLLAPIAFIMMEYVPFFRFWG